jgi:hypothetical protein
VCRDVGFSHGLSPWKYLYLHTNRRERDNSNVANNDVFRKVCRAGPT